MSDMSTTSFKEAIDGIVAEDPRYSADAYSFICEALHHTSSLLGKPTEGPERHISGGELLEGIRSYAIQQYGPMAMTVLKSWGIADTQSFGEVVFNMVERGILGSTEQDSREDFSSGYRFEDAFVRPFLPVSKR